MHGCTGAVLQRCSVALVQFCTVAVLHWCTVALEPLASPGQAAPCRGSLGGPDKVHTVPVLSSSKSTMISDNDAAAMLQYSCSSKEPLQKATSCQMPYFICHDSCVICHLSYVMCHVSSFICHVSYFMCSSKDPVLPPQPASV